MSASPVPMLDFVLSNYMNFNARATRDALLAYLASAPASTASAWSLGADLFGRHAGPADLATTRRQHLGDAWGDKHARRSEH